MLTTPQIEMEDTAAVMAVPEFAARPSVSDVCRSVSTRFKISHTELRGHSKIREFALPRQMAMFISREVTGLSLTQIGLQFDRDHSTISLGCRATAERLRKHSGIKEHYDAIHTDLLTTPTWKSTIRSEKDAAMSVGLFIHALGVAG